MQSEIIKNFWEQNPCGEHLILGKEEKIENFKQFFLEYDKFRYETEQHILSNLDKVDFSNKKVLEIGIGQGADSQQIIERGAEYFGLDMTEEACQRAKLRFSIFQKPYKDVIRGSVSKIPFPDQSFDIVYSHGVLHHIPDIKTAVEELKRVLKDDGKLIIMVYARKSLNYCISILFLRRILFLGLYLLDKITFRKVVKNKVFRKHIENAEREGVLNYLSTRTFLSRNTDGPDNPYSRVYSQKDVNAIFSSFEFGQFEQHFLNERQLPVFKIFPLSWRQFLANRFGWHLWCYGHKKGV